LRRPIIYGMMREMRNGGVQDKTDPAGSPKTKINKSVERYFAGMM
jgi:hypothetical protein